MKAAFFSLILITVPSQLAAQGALELLTPEDSATGVPINPTFAWSHPSLGSVFTLEVSTTPEFSSLVVDLSDLDSDSIQVEGLEYSTVYYWRVRIGNGLGGGALSQVRSFTTIVAAPLAPLLTLPEDGAIHVSLAPTLMWNSVSGAESYHVQVSTDSSFSELVVDQSHIHATKLEFSGLKELTQYFWRVKAKNAGGAGQYSAVSSFTTVFLVYVGWQLALPQNGATDVSLTPTLSWDGVSYAETYLVEVSTYSNFSELVVNEHGITGTEIQVSGLLNNTTYYWRVAAVYSFGMGTGIVHSEERSFTTIAAPTSVERLDNEIPETFDLSQNFPNPFNPMTTIQFSVAKESRVMLAIFNTLGAVVEVLADQTYAPGNYQVQWIPQNLASGVYFYRLQTAEFTHTRKLLLLR